MKKQRFAEEQIIAVLKEQEAGAKVGELSTGHDLHSSHETSSF